MNSPISRSGSPGIRKKNWTIARRSFAIFAWRELVFITAFRAHNTSAIDNVCFIFRGDASERWLREVCNAKSVPVLLPVQEQTLGASCQALDSKRAGIGAVLVRMGPASDSVQYCQMAGNVG